MAGMNSRQEHGAEATHTHILDVAERLVQTRGFNGFSYADIASEVGITKASLHYHFATKAELGVTLIARYSEAFAAALQRISATPADTARRLRAYVKLYADVLTDQRMCLCGMLAAEYQTLPEHMREAVTSFFDANEGWLEKVLDEGKQDGTLHFPGTARETARVVIACLEGAMLVSRPYADADRFEAMATSLLAGLTRDQ